LTRFIGIDPGLQKTGWGIIEKEGSILRFICGGQIKTDSKTPMGTRLAKIDNELSDIITGYRPDSAAIEETFVNCNPASALLLGQARGVAIAAAARLGLPVSEYSANLVKKSLVGNGHATKDQISMMIGILLPSAKTESADEDDALAIAICHAHHVETELRVTG
jgi:crossover junction endodeoxyribonuclease RuvC